MSESVGASERSYPVRVHLRELHWGIRAEVVNSDHVISAAGGQEHPPCYEDKTSAQFI